MRLHTSLLWVVNFVKGLVGDLRSRYFELIKDLLDFNKVARKSIASFLILVMFLPFIIFGQAKPVYAAPSPIDSLAVPQSFPNPYDFSASGSGNASAPLYTPAAFLGVWDYVSSWFASSETFDDCPTGYTSLGGVISSDPTTSVFGNKIFVFARGTDGAVYYQTSTNGSTFSGWLGLGGIITSNPASASSGSSLVVEGTGTDSNRYYQTTTNGSNFSGWTSGTMTTQTNPSAGFNGQIHTFVKGAGTAPHLCHQAATPTPTPTPTSTPPSSPNSTPVQTATTLPTSTNLSRVRLALVNGTGGTNPYSRNFGWSTSLAGLPGRGMDAEFGISYNSLIWTRVGNDMVFNPNQDNVTPGFRFGYPVIEPSYSDPVTSKNTFLMVAPSGGRVEFRQLPASNNTYETVDSSYVQLKVLDANNIVVTDTSGTNAFYELKAGAFRVASIKDSNGNYVTVSYDTNGLLQSVTDTLGRIISVGYDNQGLPTSVTQTRSTGTFTYASLSYGNVTLGTNFTGLNTVGIAGNGIFKALTKITYPDGSSTQFDYNAYGQVWKVSNYSAENYELNYTAVNLQNVIGAQTDVPRFSEIRNWAQRFNLNTSNVAQETVTSIVYQENAGFILPNNTTVTGTLLHITAPDGTVSRTFVGGTTTGWQEGLPILSEDWANESSVWNRKRWNYSVYAQDDTNLAYLLNPRTIESKIGDSANVRRSTVEYWTQTGNVNAALFGLTKEVKVYDADQTTVLKRSTMDYNLDAAYLSRRIIGLPQKSELFDQANNLMSKVTYQYDEGNFSGTNQTIAPVQHDATNFGAGFITGRGNLTSTTRWDVATPTNTGAAITNNVKYDIAGNQVASIDPLGRTVSISYADSYEDNQNHSSYAYPTQITDPANNSSTVKYRFDFGANVYATSPAPAGNTVGKTTSRIYDSIGRLEKETINNTGAYTRYTYPSNGTQSFSYSTIVDKLNNGADSSDEVITESKTDGAGRVISSRTEHPGSVGEWAASLTVYDVMGRVKSASVPTEVDINWNPAGDDATRGFLWTTNEYDWKGRVTRTINTDDTDKLYSYEGCGCAGGQVTTVQGEQTVEYDWQGAPVQTLGRRTQKVYADILGRTYKSETLNWNGSVYSASTNSFNGRDQVTLSRQFAGDVSSTTYQDTTLTYDGHGRLKTQHRPEQNANTATVYNYNSDDRVQSVSDARGATAAMTYNNLGLPTQINYTVPSGVAPTPNVVYTYDATGNRTQMTDGLGTVSYTYNQLAQVTSETRAFNDYLPNAPLAGNSFKLEFSYGLSGQLKSYTDAYNQQFNYVQDKIGRLQQINGSSSFGGVTGYANNAAYRAWGAIKHQEYGTNAAALNMTYNNRLQAATFVLSRNGTNIMDKEYRYQAGGELRFVDDRLNINNTFNHTNNHDRAFKYDHLGRTVSAVAGPIVRGESATPDDTPYDETFTYNNLNNPTSFQGTNWTYSINGFYMPSYVNNRAANKNYDAEGNMTNDSLVYNYDAANRMSLSIGEYIETTRLFEGGGTEVKRITRTRVSDTSAWSAPKTFYFIKSSVMEGQTINEVKSDGAKERAYVYGTGGVVAKQLYANNQEQVDWEHTDAAGLSLLHSVKNDSIYPVSGASEIDAAGNDVGLEKPFVYTPHPGEPSQVAFKYPDYASPGDDVEALAMQQSGGCTWWSTPVDCSKKISDEMRASNAEGQTTPAPMTLQFTGGKLPELGEVNIAGGSEMHDQFLKQSKERVQTQLTQQPKQTYPNCYTFYDLLYKNEELKKIFDGLWSQTSQEAAGLHYDRTVLGKIVDRPGEHGGVLFFDETKNVATFQQFTGYKTAKPKEDPGLPDDYLQQLEKFKQDRKADGNSARILLVVHTHPPEDLKNVAKSQNPSSNDYQNILLRAYGFDGPLFGVVITGRGKLEVFGRELSGDDETLKRTCVKNKP